MREQRRPLGAPDEKELTGGRRVQEVGGLGPGWETTAGKPHGGGLLRITDIGGPVPGWRRV